MWKGIIKKYAGKCKIRGCKNQANPDVSYIDGPGEVIVDVMRAKGLPHRPYHFCEDHQDDFLASRNESLMAGRFEPYDMKIVSQIAGEYRELEDIEPLEEGEQNGD